MIDPKYRELSRHEYESRGCDYTEADVDELAEAIDSRIDTFIEFEWAGRPEAAA